MAKKRIGNKWIQKMRLEKGALHRWARVAPDHRFTEAELTKLLRRAHDLRVHAQLTDDDVAFQEGLRAEKMVRVAKQLRHFRHYRKRKKGYGKKR